jgi:glycosyltransferase involved in cell wall biosynthesis
VTAVHQALSGAGPVDAVTGQALMVQRLLREWGHEGGVFADAIDPRIADRVKPLVDFQPGPDDVLLVRYSAYAPKLRPLVEWPQRKLLVYHNVTPAKYLWNHHPGVAVACSLGRDQLPVWARAASVATADSEFNAAELRAAGAAEVRSVPILFDPAPLAERGTSPSSGDGPLVLAVGRLTPNKSHDLVLAAFALYQRECAPDARLLCVGPGLSPQYERLVTAEVERSGARNVVLAGSVPQADLNAAYAEADVLLSMSEHEGFCVPLLEAFHFALPVVARPAGAMPEVGGDAVVWDHDDDLAVTAELIDLAVRDDELRATASERGRAQLERFSLDRSEAALRAAVEATLASRRS